MSKIKDSGNRREFPTGAVRDMAEGKGRCDLMPLDVIGRAMNNNILKAIDSFQTTSDVGFLYAILSEFIEDKWFYDSITPYSNAFLELAKHFEEGAIKYGVGNWKVGLPTDCYIDSAIRHYLKWLREDDDEPHDRAFVWNIVCCIWTCEHKPELNVYKQNTD